VRAARSPLVVLLLAAAVSGQAQSAFDLSVSTDDLADAAAVLSAGLDVVQERLLGDAGALRWKVEAAGSWVPPTGSLSGSASAQVEASQTSSARVLTGWLSGHAAGSGDEGPGPVSAAIGASLVFNGDLVGWSLEPWLDAQWLVEPRLDTGIAARMSLLAGSVVLEPQVSAGLRWDAEASPWIRLEPGLELSWYPGIPFLVEAGFLWTARVASPSSWDSEWAGTLSLAGALGGVMLVDATCSLGRGSDGISVDANAEVSMILGTLGGGELSLPVRCVVSASDAEGVIIGAGAGLRFSW
jgi:hypothetical protein